MLQGDAESQSGTKFGRKHVVGKEINRVSYLENATTNTISFV